MTVSKGFSADWFITNIVGNEGFMLCHQTNSLVFIKLFREKPEICEWNIIPSEFPETFTSLVNYSVQKTFAVSCNFNVVWLHKQQNRIIELGYTPSGLMVDLFDIEEQSWILDMLNTVNSLYEHSGKKKISIKVSLRKDT